MPTCKDYKQMGDRVAQIAIACSTPCVAEALMALALDHMTRAAGLGEPAAAKEQLEPTPQDHFAGYGD
jgi:hypothetical protein